MGVGVDFVVLTFYHSEAPDKFCQSPPNHQKLHNDLLRGNMNMDASHQEQ